ncbi:MAG: glycosyltransferase [Cyanobium sp.]
MHLYTYGEVTGVPEGVVEISGEEILPRERVFSAPGILGHSFASFADLFRLELLVQRGGWWFDMDMVCIRHLPTPQQLTFASTWEGEWGECAVNSAMWCLPGDPYLIELSLRAQLIIRSGEVAFGSLGPFLLQALIRESNLQVHVAPWTEFCPYPWRMVHRLALPGPLAYAKDQIRMVKHVLWQRNSSAFRAGYVRPNSRTLHLYNEIWKSTNLDKDGNYFYFSPIEMLKRQYLFDLDA